MFRVAHLCVFYIVFMQVVSQNCILVCASFRPPYVGVVSSLGTYIQMLPAPSVELLVSTQIF